MICNLTAGITEAACKIANSGVVELLIGNYSDLQTLKDSGAITTEPDTGALKNFPLANPMFRLQLNAQDSLSGQTELVAGTYFNKLRHTINFNIITADSAVKNFLNELENTRVFVVMKTKLENTGGVDYKILVWGFDSGLKCSTLTMDTTMPDDSYFAVTLASTDNALESALPNSLWADTAAGLETLYEGLYATSNS